MNINKSNIANALHSMAREHVVTTSNEVFDESTQMYQNEINSDIYAKMVYCVCESLGNTEVKQINVSDYVLSIGGSIKIKFEHENTFVPDVQHQVKLKIGSEDSKPLYYDGEPVTAANTWEAGETVDVYYDGTNYYANNVAGGGGSGDGAFDVSAKYPTSGVEGGNTYTLEGALAVLNTNLSASKKKGGMSIKFVQSSDNKYVQYRYMGTSTATADFTDEADWQGVDDEPTAGSDNLVKSGGVYNAINLFSHPLANRVIKELYIPNVDYTAFTKISVWLCYLHNEKYWNIIRLFVSNEDNLYLYLKSFDTEEEALADMANNMNGLYEKQGQYTILSVSPDLAGTNITKEDFTINRDIANLNNSPVIKESLDKVSLEASIVGKEAFTNKVSAWSQIPTDAHYPSEKLVHDTILTPLNSISKTIESGSKNLYDYEHVGVLSGIIASKGYVAQTYNGFYTGKIPVEPNHYYYLSNRSDNVARAVRCLDANDNVMKVLAPSNGEEYDDYYLPNVDATGSAPNGQFKTPVNAAYIQINLTPLNVTEIGNYYQIMLEDVGDAYNPNFVPSEYEPYDYTTIVKDGSLQYPVKPLADKVEALADNSTITVKLLCVGSSFTQDEFSYLPFILNSIAPNVKLTIGIAYIGGSPLPQHCAYLTHADSEHRIESDVTAYWVEDGVSKPYKKLHIDNSELTEYAGYILYKSVDAEPWSSVGSMLIEDVLTNEDWDIVTYQGAAAQAFKSWDDYYAPYIFEIVKQVNAKVGNNVKLAFNLIHSGYATSDEEFLSRWLETAKNAKKVLQQTGISLLFPSGTAIQNLRCIDALRAMGDNTYHNLLADTAHLQDGIGPLCTAYANALTLLKAVGIDYEGVIGEGTRPDAAWITDNNIPGPHIGSGVIGITDDYCLLAQIAATNAVKYPYSIINPSVSAPYTDRDTGNKLGISKDELSTDVQASLNKADSAYQKPSSGIPASDLASGVIPDVRELEDTAVRTGSYDASLRSGAADNLSGDDVQTLQFVEHISGEDYTTGTSVANTGQAVLEKVEGESRVWNQLVPNNSKDTTNANTDARAFTLQAHWYESSTFISSRTISGSIGTHTYILTAPANATRVVIKHNGATIDFIFYSILVQGGHIILLNYNVVANDTTVINGVEIDDNYIIDLTLLGIDNLTTVAQVEEWLKNHPSVGLQNYYPYDEGSIKNTLLTEVVTTGRNQLKVTNGTGKAKVFGGKTYVIGGTHNTTGDWCLMDGVAVSPTQSGDNYTYQPASDGELTVTGCDDDSFVVLQNDDRGYSSIAPYKENHYGLDVTRVYGKLNGAGEYVKVAPDGLRSAGTVADEIDLKSRKGVVRIGSVDLGTLTGWKKRGESNTFGISFGRTNKESNYSTVANGICTEEEERKALLWSVICATFS